ncbi:Replicase polyprotein 1a [Frankliniella fusca]|uniref:Replicase polyprotein 1a n=1 Tax=Frankliniella fusca TaxID=407009 RepID=A0AAE1HBY5_9NEOP|nr:Replicase polyprotein 1a [Frankliniella fusca]
MTVAKAMKSPGQKTKTPKKGPITPNVKSPKVKGVGTPAGTPKQKGSNMDKTPKKPVTPANGTPKPKTPKMNGSNKPQTPNPKGNATPKLKTPKSEEPQANVTPNVISQKPNKSPKSLGKRSAEAAGLDNKAPSTVSKFLRIYNLPNMENEKLMGEVKKLLEPRGEIVKMKREKGCIVVEYAKGEDARAAKKLNGVVVGGRHLTFVHIEDRDLPTEHRITITQCPNNMTDEDVWSLFGSCGKILSIHFNRHWKTRIIQKCFVTFDNKKAVQQALSKPKTLGGKTLSVAEVTTDTRALHAAYPIENTVYLLGLPADVADTDVKKLVGKVCPVTAVTIVEATRRYAIVYITNESDVEKALKLNGTVLNGTKLKAERSRKSAHYKKSEDASVKKVKKEVPAKKQKLDKKAAQVKEESEEEDDDDEEEEEDDDDDDSEDLLAAFQGKMQELKQKGTKDDDEEGDDDDDDDEEEDEDDDDEDGDEDDEDEEGDEDDEEADDDDDDDDDDE